MAITIFFIYVIMIYLPGILWAQTDRKHGFGTDKSWQAMMFKVHIFGVFTYILLVYILNGVGMVFDIPEFRENLFIKLSDNFNPAVIQSEIVSAIPLAVIMSLLWLYVINYELIEKFLAKIKAVDPAKHASVFKYILETAEKNGKLVSVTNSESNCKCIGLIETYSETKERATLVLNNVTIINLDTKMSKIVEQYYYSRPPDKFDFEILSQEEANR